MKFFMILLDDLQIYSYDARNYTGLLKSILDTINQVEELKWKYGVKLLNLSISEYEVPVSKSTPYIQGDVPIKGHEPLIQSVF